MTVASPTGYEKLIFYGHESRIEYGTLLLSLLSAILPFAMPRHARLASLADTARQFGVSTSGIAKALARAERP